MDNKPTITIGGVTTECESVTIKHSRPARCAYVPTVALPDSGETTVTGACQLTPAGALWFERIYRAATALSN